jgi:hypothetical protein
MNLAVDDVRARVGQSIEQIMLDQVSNQLDGLGPCTTVVCLLEASINAARIYILEKQMQHQQQDHGYYGPDGEYHDNEYHGDGEYHDGEYHQPATAGGCEEMCYMDMESMRFTDERAAKDYMKECMNNC